MLQGRRGDTGQHPAPYRGGVARGQPPELHQVRPRTVQ